MPLTLNTQITAVTVYNHQALITRKGTVQLKGSETELVVSSLPITLETDSVRVSGSGTQNIKLLGIKTEAVTTLEATTPEVADLEAQIQTLEHQQQRYADQLAAVQLKLQSVEGLSKQSIPVLSKQIVTQQTLEETKTLWEFLGQHHEEYAKAITTIKGQQATLQQQLGLLQARLRKLQDRRPHEHYQLIIKIAPAAASSVDLEITYMVSQAQWQPLYDLQFNTHEGALQLSYLAEVVQTSGEAWSGIPLTLSTAKPGLGSLPPKLQPWFINLPQPQMSLRRRSAAPAGALPPESEGDDDAEEVSMTAPAPSKPATQTRAEVVTADISKTGSVVSFSVGGNSDIPSDGNPHTVTLTFEDYPADCQFIAIPSRISFAYLQTTVHNPADGVTLLPGKANIFRDRTFVGTTQLGHIAPGQNFQVDLGIDEGLGIERELIERQVDKKLMSGQRRITFAYRLVVTNFLEQVAQLKLIEQLPISRDERLKVRLTQSQPKIESGELGQLEWTLTLTSQQPQVIEYQFTLEHPPTESVIGLDV